jgi:3D (Asp-Asp-Asp) domain-containing protein
MNLIATALVMGILFLPGASVPARAESATTPATIAQPEEPSPRKVATRAESVTPSYQVKLTGYNAVPSQTDGDPSTTASGAASNHEVIAARSHDLAEELPFGTVVRFSRVGVDTPGCNFHKVEHLIGYRVVADTMNARWTKRMDVELDAADTVKVEGRNVNPGLALGVCSTVTVEVVGHIPLSRIPKTQAELAHLYAPHELALK